GLGRQRISLPLQPASELVKLKSNRLKGVRLILVALEVPRRRDGGPVGEVVATPLEPSSPPSDPRGEIAAGGRLRQGALHLDEISGCDVLEHLLREDQLLLRRLLGGLPHCGCDRVKASKGWPSPLQVLPED